MTKNHLLYSGFFLTLTIFYTVVSQPIDFAAEDGENGPVGDSRKSIANVNPSGRSAVEGQDGGKVETKVQFPFPRVNGNEQNSIFANSVRSRRSSFGVKNQSPSAELQTLMSGNWQTLDPDSLFKLLNTLSTSKERLPDDFYGDYNEEDPIDLVYSGKKPLMSSSSGHRASLRGVAEPISIMSSNKARVYQYADDDLDAQPLQMHRLYKKSLKRSSPWMPISARRDLVQFSNGEIAFTPHGVHVFRFHQPALGIDEEIPVIRRPIL